MLDVPDRSTRPRQTMKRAVIVVGFTCTNNCIFCVAADKRGYPDKSTVEIKKEIQQAYANGARDIVFTGGECTIRKDILELVAYARKAGFLVINIQTNGRAFASKDFCKKMLLAGMTTLQPALHGHRAELHDSLTRRKGSFRQTVLGIHNVLAMTHGSTKVLTNTVVVKANYRFLPDIVTLLIGLRVHLSQFAFVHAMGHASRYFKKVVPRKTDVLPYLKKAIEIGKKEGLRVVAEAIPLCLMKGYERHVSEFYIPSTELWDRGQRIPKFEVIRINEAKEKFPQCQECCCQSSCEGPWREYPQHFGSDEFQPIVSR